ncbi:L,D-transpeptidase family protein [Alkalilimnicola sp. S0819]|uniref:L,D-transpeptidase family protein n=1 Tax=Alkalilimnicola sp. S0819 TaxID=2613922 RepID=UPI001262A3F8|nr:L,D-transpeptidase [Alkalilimnicola sp. S0819]KAB7619497.1 L,D-transpeptidase [Alkalilimnicola sp. S0819]MPQ17675.1 L,D-transpeptidase family protein [Alkalilimnicola sp. S0819]
MTRRLLLCLLLLVAAPLAQAEDAWVLVDTQGQRVHVYKGKERIARFPNIAIGRNGAALTRLRGDNTTPLGTFRISRINRESRFHIFLELDYPTLPHAKRALKAGLIDRDAYQTVLDSRLRYGRAPQNTLLGGQIGLHGIGAGDPLIHRRFNWTEGCVALTNDEIEKLASLVKVGTRVIIR